MNIRFGDDIVSEVRTRTLVKYEGYIRDMDGFQSDMSYRRGFDVELRKEVDSVVGSFCSVVVFQDRKKDGEQPDEHSARLMFRKASRCFPDVFFALSEMNGIEDCDRGKYILERMSSPCVHKMASWNKYSKGKGKNETVRPDNK